MPILAEREKGDLAAPRGKEWVFAGYKAAIIFFIVDGIGELVLWGKLLAAASHRPDIYGPRVWPILAMSALSLITGLGLLSRFSGARTLANIYCFARLAYGLSRFRADIIGALGSGLFGVFYALISLIGMVFAGVMLYMIGVTTVEPASRAASLTEDR